MLQKKAEERFIETETQEIFKKKMLKEAREHKQFAEWLEEFKQYKEAEEQGLLLKLPCKVGDTVYKIINQRDSFDDRPYKIVTAVSFNLSMIEEINKSVFLTQEQAEEVLKHIN